MLAEVEAEKLSNNLVKVMAELLVDTLTDSVTTDRRQFILFYLFYFPLFLVFYLHICVLVRTSGQMIVMGPESTC